MINRRDFIRNVSMAALLGVTGRVSAWADGSGAERPIRQAQGRPNVVLLFIDDLGYADTGPFGCKDIPTPNIDRLAKEGTTLEQAYVTNPPCCPSRCSLMMGMYGQSFGKYGMSRGLSIPDDKPTLGEFMRDNGYVTGQVGKWDLGNKLQGPASRGFMEVAENPPRVGQNGKSKGSRFLYKTEEGKTGWLTEYDGDKLVEFVERNTRSTGSPRPSSGQAGQEPKPFFMYWSPMAVHSPSKDAPARLTSRSTAPDHRRKLAGAIISVDDQVGKLLDYLDKHKMRENTLIILSSDNGANLNEGGSSAPYRGGKNQGTQQIGWTLSPTIISWPGVIPQAKRFKGLSCTLDFYATIAAAARLPAPKHLQGVDLVPYLRGDRKGDPHEYLFWLNNDPSDAKHRHLVAVRWKRWRLYRKQDSDPWQLFDLVKDPREEKDVAGEFPDVVKGMDKAYVEWKTTHVAPPKAVKVRTKNPVQTGYGWLTSDGRLKPEIVDNGAK